MKPSDIRPITAGLLLIWTFTSSDSQIPNSDLRLSNPECRIPNPDLRLPNSDSRSPFHDSRLTTYVSRFTIHESRKVWIQLFDGKSPAGWRGACGQAFPDTGWVIRDGALTVLAAGNPNARRGGDIVTLQRFSDFELRFEFKITEGANSGIKYFVQENLPNAPGAAIGMEYQILDDDRHEDAKAGKNGNHANASLYDLVPAENKKNKPAGEWNSARILVRGGHIEHWLNGRKVLEIERGTETFRKLVSESKYRIYPGFGEWKDGHILLQDHGNEVSFRNIRIREP